MRMDNWMRCTAFGLLVICLAGSERVFAADLNDAEFFEAKVRPLLIAKCNECHGSDKSKAGLRLDAREAILTGGESGPAAVTGKPDESLLMDVISYRNGIQMPPKSKLPEAEIAILTEWVRRGLPWPNSKPSVPVPAPAEAASHDFTEDEKSFWAFQPVRRALPPEVMNAASIRSPIDRFVVAELEARGLVMSREAERRTLMRRVTLDLTGLPPAPDEVDEFVTDAAPDALERVVDRLLASPRYGERWGRHWLDLARYADSNGLDENLAYANAFRYRDYVVKSFREDKPYDRFLIEQIAGDLLDPEPGTDSFDALVATGFLCLGAKMLAEDDPVKMQMDIIDEQVDTIGRAVMGLTMGCARCHDHKFDPITAEDYYGLAGIFKSTQTMDTFSVVARWHERPLATPSQLQHRDEMQQLANIQKQAIQKRMTEATDAILSAARQRPGAYLLAATREFQIAEQLRTAKPRGSEPNPAATPGAILIEAEEYARGNVSKEFATYGNGIGVLVNRGETPNFAEYDIHVVQAGTFQLEIRYAAASARPVKLFVDGRLIKPDAASKVTGSWTPESQSWFVEAFVPLDAGPHLIRLEQPQFFPHIDKLLLTLADMSSDPALTLPQATEADVQLPVTIVRQWVKTLEATRSDPKSILAAWHRFSAGKPLNGDAVTPENGVARLLSDAPPTSLTELAARYDRLFADASQAWIDLKASAAGKEAKMLPDPILEAARAMLVDPKGPYAVPADIESLFAADLAATLKVDRDELSRREKAVPGFVEAMAVADLKPENLKIHLRGSHLTLGREVPRRLPRILTRTKTELTDGSGRLSFARWLVTPDNPLTARVMVNRVWQWHFGQGLVRSPDNFGRLGERPSHPELLDWLASEFSVPDGPATITASTSTEPNPRSWSLKAVHRMLLGSSAYRQSTDHNAEAALSDPENRLLWRFHRQRMDVEVLRDSLLALSGRLDETPGGTLLPTANRAYVTSTANVNPAIYNSNRRSIYLPVVRSALFELFTAFDFADPSTLAGQRDQTTVAPQALFMMNSAFVLDQARAIAQGLLERPELDPVARMRHLYRLAYCREPTEAEVSRATAYLDRIGSAMAASEVEAGQVELRAWTSLCRAVLAANEFIYVE